MGSSSHSPSSSRTADDGASPGGRRLGARAGIVAEFVSTPGTNMPKNVIRNAMGIRASIRKRKYAPFLQSLVCLQYLQRQTAGAAAAAQQEVAQPNTDGQSLPL